VLDTFDEIQVAVAYRYKETGAVVERFPASLHTLEQLEPVYETLPGWKTPTCHINTYEALPEACKTYIETLERVCRCPIWMVSVGPDRAETMMRRSIF
jgi:adenylosuccinate synthase